MKLAIFQISNKNSKLANMKAQTHYISQNESSQFSKLAHKIILAYNFKEITPQSNLLKKNYFYKEQLKKRASIRDF